MSACAVIQRILRLIGRPARPLSHRKCNVIMSTYGRTCASRKEHLLP